MSLIHYLFIKDRNDEYLKLKTTLDNMKENARKHPEWKRGKIFNEMENRLDMLNPKNRKEFTKALWLLLAIFAVGILAAAAVIVGIYLITTKPII